MPSKGVLRTTYTAHANCTRRVLHLKDKLGVSFGGGGFSSTDLSRQLGAILCETPLPAAKKKKS